MIDNIKILHLANDNMFIDSAYKSFESIAPLCNTFFIPSFNNKLKNIKETPAKIINPISYRNPLFIKSLEKYDMIILHSLMRFNMEVVAHAGPRSRFVWIGMGGDYYDIIYEDSESLYQEQTKEIVKNLTVIKSPNSKKINSDLKQLARSILYKSFDKKAIIEKIDFFAPVLENEYDIVASKFNFNFPDYVDWNYGISSKMIDGKIKHSNLNGDNILIGNSATPENNHLEIFDFLRTQNLSGKKIICPLSYGDFEYASVLKDKGKACFGDHFLSVDKFMPYEDYINLIKSCSNVIMNHHRQQGVGTLLSLLYLGAKVFLNEKSPLYLFYKEKGMVVFSIDELYNNLSLLDSHLSKEDFGKNKYILKSLYSEKMISKRTERLIKKVMSSSKTSD